MATLDTSTYSISKIQSAVYTQNGFQDILSPSVGNCNAILYVSPNIYFGGFFDRAAPDQNSPSTSFSRTSYFVPAIAPITDQLTINTVGCNFINSATGLVTTSYILENRYADVHLIFDTAANAWLIVYGSECGCTGPTGAASSVTGPTGSTGPVGPQGAGGAQGYYGSFYDGTTQGAFTQNTVSTITINSTDLTATNGVYLGGATGATFSRIYNTYAGVYNVQFSAQLTTNSGGNNAEIANIFIKKNGAIVPDTDGQVSIPTKAGGSIAAWNYLLALNAGDYIEFCINPATTSVYLSSLPASGTASPASPSIIVTYTQAAYNGPTGPTGPVSILGGGTGSLLLNGTGGVYYSEILTAKSNQLDITGNLVPTVSNTFTLGYTGSRWKEIFIGPGSLNIAGPTGAIPATIGANLAGIAYSQYGFATPFLNIGPSINELAPLGTVGGWNIFGTGPTGGNFTDLRAQLINTGGSGFTGPSYSLIYNNGYTGEAGPTGPTGTSQVNIVYLGNTGYTGPPIGTGSTGYFLDSFNLPITVTNTSNKYLINASCQLLVDSNLKNVSTSILRSNTGMSGSTLPTSYVNLANNAQADVKYPPLHVGTSDLNDLNTSLWSYSVQGNPGTQSVNGITINMQAYDTGFTGPGTYYYAIRVNTDTVSIYYGNIRMSSISFS